MLKVFKSKTILFAIAKALLGIVAYYLGWIDGILLNVILGEAVVATGLRSVTHKPLRDK